MRFYIGVLNLFIQIFSVSAQPFRHSRAGEYYVEVREVEACPKEKRGTNEIFTDLHLTRKRNKREIVGNITFAVSYDDPLKINFAILSSNLAWLPNAYSTTFLKGCTDGLMGFAKGGWTNFVQSFNMPSSCPLRKGFYQVKGYDVDNFLKNSLLPKQFIYGRYKITAEYFNKKDVLLGCSYFVIDVLPLWQKKRTTVR